MTEPVLVPGLVALVDPVTGRFSDSLAPPSVAANTATAAAAATAAASAKTAAETAQTAAQAAKVAAETAAATVIAVNADAVTVDNLGQATTTTKSFLKATDATAARAAIGAEPVGPYRYADRFPGANTRAQIDAAIADLGGVPGVVVLPQGFGAGTPSVQPTNVTLWDLRGGLPVDGGVAINAKTPGVADRMRIHQWTDNPDRSVVALDTVQDISGAMADPSSAEGVTGQVRLRGALTNSPSTNFAMIGVEGNVTIYSTGNTVARARGGTFNVFTAAGSTTNLTNGEVLVAQAMVKSGTGTITNAYGVVAEDQSVGSTRNYSMYAGHFLFRNNRNIDAEDVGGTARRFITFSNGDLCLFRPLSDTVGFKFGNQANSASWLTLNSTAAALGLPLTVAGNVTADGVVFANTKGLRFQAPGGDATVAVDSSNQLNVTGPSVQTRFLNHAFSAVNLAVKDAGDVTIGRGSPATTATTGFPYIPAGAGTPTGVPTGSAGFAPLYYDTSANRLWVYDNGWKASLFSTPTAATAETVWVPATDFVAGTGAPAMSTVSSRTPCWVLDAATTENVRGSFNVPANWNTAKVELVWSATGAGTGDAEFTITGGPLTSGVAVADTFGTSGSFTGTAPAAGTPLTSVVIASAAVTPGPAHVRVQRQAPNAGDTLTTDAAVLGVVFTRLT